MASVLPWDPVHTAWRAQHPAHDLPAGQDCARCASAAGTVACRDVVSRKFTAWDTWVDPSAPRLCPACVWGYRTTELRAEPLLVTWHPTAPSCHRLAPAGLLEVLSCGHLPASSLVSVPLRAGRRHVLPTAAFGQVCVDGTNITWSSGDARRLELVDRLRRAGVGWSAFTDPVPPWRVVSSSSDPVALLTRWEELAPWRESGLWLQVALSATHPARARAA